MRYAIIEDGVVMNIGAATPEYADEQGWVACPDGCEIGWLYDGEEFTTPAPTISPVPIAVTPLQMRRALRIAGLKAGIDTFLAQAGEEAEEAWEYAVEIRRDDVLVNMAATALNKSPEELDDLFRLAASITTTPAP